ncbi:hypothetical protein STRTUCAR8_03909, partial [Streptomyces turgidiscabies Car8]
MIIGNDFYDPAAGGSLARPAFEDERFRREGGSGGAAP